MGTWKLLVSCTRKKWQASSFSFHKAAERGAHTGAGLLALLVTPWGTHAGAGLWRTAAWGKDSKLEKFMGACLPWEEPCDGAGEECEEYFPWEERRSRHNDELTATPFPIPCVNGVKRQRKSGVKLKWEGRRSGRKAFLKFEGFFCHYPIVVWLVINKINFPKLSLLCPWQCAEYLISLSLSWPKSLEKWYFFPPLSSRWGVVLVA